MLLRSELHKMGYRYRLHWGELPGRPDLVLPKYNAVIFVNGCFWHGHDCHLFKWPKTNSRFWRKKIKGNQQRDKKNIDQITSMGWRCCIVWECCFRGKARLPKEKSCYLIDNWILSSETFLELYGGDLEFEKRK